MIKKLYNEEFLDLLFIPLWDSKFTSYKCIEYCEGLLLKFIVGVGVVLYVFTHLRLLSIAADLRARSYLIPIGAYGAGVGGFGGGLTFFPTSHRLFCYVVIMAFS
jgi:hypothetical protein